jgi:hypothetical protein
MLSTMKKTSHNEMFFDPGVKLKFTLSKFYGYAGGKQAASQNVENKATTYVEYSNGQSLGYSYRHVAKVNVILLGIQCQLLKKPCTAKDGGRHQVLDLPLISYGRFFEFPSAVCNGICLIMFDITGYNPETTGTYSGNALKFV